MRPSVVAVLLGALALCANAAFASPIVLDFEGLATMPHTLVGSPVPSAAQLSDAYLSTYGVRFESGDPFVAVVDLGIGHATSGSVGLGGSRPTGELTYDRAFPVVASFFDPSDPGILAVTDFVSVRGDFSGTLEPITLNAFDIHGALLASFTTTDFGGPTLLINTPGIHSVRFLGTHDYGGVALDDFTFNAVTPVSPVPEPSTLLIVASGFATWGGLAWRRHRTSRDRSDGRQ